MNQMHEDDGGTWDALQRLTEGGSDLSRPLEMDFHVAVPDEASGRTVAARAAALGFATEVLLDDDGKEWTCWCTQVIVPAYETVRKIEAELDALGRDVGGYADGFGSYGNGNEA